MTCTLDESANNPDKYGSVYEEAIDRFGETPQMLVAIEEFSELSAAISRMLTSKGDLLDLVTEVADAEIMLSQIKLLYDISSVVIEEKQRKIDRLKNALLVHE